MSESEKPKVIRKLPKPPGAEATIAEVRKYFQTYKPTLDELLATGEYTLSTMGEVMERRSVSPTNQHDAA